MVYGVLVWANLFIWGELTRQKLKKSFCSISHFCCPPLTGTISLTIQHWNWCWLWRQLGKAEAPYQGTCCGTEWAVAMVCPFHPCTHHWCFTNSPQRQKLPICQLCTEAQMSSEGAIHILLLLHDGSVTPNSFLVKRNSRSLAPLFASHDSKAKQNHGLTHEFRQPALQTQKEKKISVEEWSFWWLAAHFFHMVWSFFSSCC